MNRPQQNQLANAPHHPICPICVDCVLLLDKSGIRHDGFPCYDQGTLHLTNKDMALALALFRADITKYWPPHRELLACDYIYKPDVEVKSLQALGVLCQYYTFPNVAMMVNATAMTRIRRGVLKTPIPIWQDFRRVLDLCRTVNWGTIQPRPLAEEELLLLNLQLDHRGLIAPLMSHLHPM
ncbi:hypothetical protein GGS26DRAFT_592985 [Hypomontagnella submonticulosa]|nr:hypothetical protein GGS26DRAFT_592985 [Hypomontagnella submonticulosa]